MRPKQSSFLALAVAFVFVVAPGCGDDGGGGGEDMRVDGHLPDIGVDVKQDMEADAEVDAAPDMEVDAAADVGPDVEVPDIGPDMAPDMAPDVGVDTVIVTPDLGPDGPPGAPTNDTCGTAAAVAWSGTTATASGDTTLATDTLNFPSSGCSDWDTEGPDLFYRLSVTAGSYYQVTVTPDSGYNAAVYVLDGCSAPLDSCVVGEDEEYSGDPETLYFQATATGNKIIVVDSEYSSSLGRGGFTLEVTEYTSTVAGDGCSDAVPMTWSGTTALVSGATTSAVNTIEMGTDGCTGADTEGPDLFYTVPVNAGTIYQVTLTPGSGYDAAVYLLSGCARPQGRCIAGADDNYSGDAEILYFTAQSDGDQIIVVDADSNGETGTFDLEVAEYTPQPGDMCSNPNPMTWSGTTASVSGDTTGAANFLGLSSSGCTSYDTEGPDLFYSVPVNAGSVYKVTLTPASGYDAALMALSSCTDPQSSCTMGSDIGSSGEVESFTFQAAASGDQILVVDSSYGITSSSSQGTFTLDVEEITPAQGDFCDDPTPLTFSAGVATVTGDTTANTNTIVMPDTSCAEDDTGAADAFYSFPMTAGQGYIVEVEPTGTSYDPAIYVFTDCQSPVSSCLAGTNDGWNGDTETVKIFAETAGTAIVGVDSADSPTDTSASGAFTLNVTEFTPPAHTACTAAKALSFSSGVATETIDLNQAIDTVNLSTSSCATDDTPGPDAFYKFTAAAGKAYVIEAVPDADTDPALYVFTDCADAEGTCVAGDDDNYSGDPELVVFTPTTAGDYIIGLDTDDPDEVGSVTLTVTETTPPANNTCGSAKTLTFTNGVATETGDLTLAGGATDTVDLSTSSCTGDDSPGPDLFYTLSATAGTSYLVEVQPDADIDPMVYVFATCGSEEATCVVGKDDGYTADPEALFFTPATSGDYVIAVDTDDATQVGVFTLTVTEMAGQPNTTCANAEVLTLNNGFVSESFTTAPAQDEFAGVDCGNADGPFEAGQVYYRVTLSDSVTYRVRLLVESSGFDAALYAFPASTACAEADINTACTGNISNEDEDGANELLELTPTTTEDWIFVVDGEYSSDVGPFTLTIEEWAGTPVFTAPVFWDFEGNCQGLDANRDWECGTLNFVAGGGCSSSAAPPPNAYSGTDVWGTKLNDCYTDYANHQTYSSCSNDDLTDDSVLKFQVAIPSGWTSATMTWWAWEDLYISYDWGEVYINGTAVDQICSGSYAAPTAWVQRSVDLSAYAGQTIDVAFHSMASGTTNYSGWYIDDLEISGS